MPPVLYIDVFEDKSIDAMFTPSVEVVRQSLVGPGYGDFMWHCGHVVTLEHKTIDQAMNEMGGRLDEQLRRYTQNADEVGLVIDGVATPILGKPECMVWRFGGGMRWEPRYKVHRSWEMFQSYLWRLDKEGITVYQAPTIESLCLAIESFIHNSFKPEHKTLRRYIKTKPVYLPNEGTEVQGYINTLMAYKGVGEVMARRLLTEYTTPWNVYNAHPADGRWPASEQVYWNILRGLGKLKGGK